MQTIEWKVEGMTCTNCAANIARYLESEGLKEVDVDFSTSTLRFQVEEERSLPRIEAELKKMGYTVLRGEAPHQAQDPYIRRILFCALFTLPLLLPHLVMSLGGAVPAWLMNGYVQLALCLPVYVVGVLQFGRSSWAAVRRGTTHMDVLIFLGSTAAFVYSLIGLYLQEPDYFFFETSATIITLVLVGNWLEWRSVKQTTTAIEELSKLQVETVRKITPSGAVVTLPQSQVMPGDRLQVNEGDRIPVDGVVLQGQATVDESMLTGESLPLRKEEGDEVVSGSLLVGGNVLMKATAVGKDTTLSRMIELVKSAQRDKPGIQRLADRVSAVFVPAVLIIALLTFAGGVGVFGLSVQQALLNSIAVLVISCPCAMGLATPTAVMVGVGRMARNGILVKGGSSVEVFSRIQTMVFDKTGTLTTGRFRLRRLETLNGMDAEIPSIIYQLERHSSHPLAKSLVEELERHPEYRIDPNSRFVRVQEVKGLGVEGEEASGAVFRLGSARFVGIEQQDRPEQLFLSRNGELLAALELEDELRPDARAAIDALKKMGIHPVLLSGDRREKTEALARLLGIEDFYAEQKPEEKLALIERLSEQAPTAMVGDGINDAPALARATIGVSLSSASRVAIQSAQIVLLEGSLLRLVKALTICRKTVQTIRQNLFWAFAYNVVAIPVAAMGYLNPMWGALFMAFSDVVVIGNSIRLKVRKLS